MLLAHLTGPGSMIICGIAAGGWIPWIIQGLWHWNQQWTPILITTLSIALCGEILPQYFIPRSPIEWGYACWPLIWLCMLLTAIISCPLALLLDFFSGKDDNRNLTNADLAALIKYQAQNLHQLNQDTAAIMLGAMRLGSRQICGYMTTLDDQDVELAEATSGTMITQWSAVKTANIDEVVDEAFIAKVKSWPINRIPVVGNTDIFGYFHVKVRLDYKLIIFYTA